MLHGETQTWTGHYLWNTNTCRLAFFFSSRIDKNLMNFSSATVYSPIYVIVYRKHRTVLPFFTFLHYFDFLPSAFDYPPPFSVPSAFFSTSIWIPHSSLIPCICLWFTNILFSHRIFQPLNTFLQHSPSCPQFNSLLSAFLFTSITSPELAFPLSLLPVHQHIPFPQCLPYHMTDPSVYIPKAVYFDYVPKALSFFHPHYYTSSFAFLPKFSFSAIINLYWGVGLSQKYLSWAIFSNETIPLFTNVWTLQISRHFY